VGPRALAQQITEAKFHTFDNREGGLGPLFAFLGASQGGQKIRMPGVFQIVMPLAGFDAPIYRSTPNMIVLEASIMKKLPLR